MTLSQLRTMAVATCAVALSVAHVAGAQRPPVRQQPTAPASSAGPIRFGLSGGLSLPAGDLGDAADAGAAIGIRAEGRLRAPRWSLRGDLALDHFDGRGGVDAYSYSSLAGNLVHREGNGRFYEFGGLGVYHARTSFIDSFNRSDTNLGVQFGVGAEFTTRAPRWFAEAGFTSAFTSGRSSLWFPVRVGFWL
jgi:hypothetical protein